MAATLSLRLIPFLGWVASVALQFAMLALVCVKGVAKGGKSVFMFKGKDYEVKVDKPLTSKADQPATKSATKASDKPKACKTKNLEARAFRLAANLVAERSIGTSVDGCQTYDVWQRTLQKMETVLSIQFANMGNMPPDFGITANPCWPRTLVNDPGFALLKDDP
ncbi:hypothetical protein ColKHC_06594 [Colletotrichum higginsianum]|nr:hypothetical protein ColKHC_06594 [Colletotrichum higginsianum]